MEPFFIDYPSPSRIPAVFRSRQATTLHTKPGSRTPTEFIRGLKIGLFGSFLLVCFYAGMIGGTPFSREITGAGPLRIIEKDIIEKGMNGRQKSALHSFQQHQLALLISRSYRIVPEAALAVVQIANKAGEKEHQDFLLLLSMLGVESGFNPFAYSRFGAKGFGQIYPPAHPSDMERLTTAQGNILNMQDNLFLSAKILGEYQRKHPKNLILVLQQYNGAMRDRKHIYATKVLHVRAQLQTELNKSTRRWMTQNTGWTTPSLDMTDTPPL